MQLHLVDRHLVQLMFMVTEQAPLDDAIAEGYLASLEFETTATVREGYTRLKVRVTVTSIVGLTSARFASRRWMSSFSAIETP